jgi:hypothetical protein
VRTPDQLVPVADQPEAVDGQGAAPTDGVRGRVVQPRLLIGLALIVTGVVWAAFRGLEFYGLNLAYDLDQPPLLLFLVGGWLWHRSRVR